MQPVVNCRDVTAAYGRKQVLHGVSLALEPGTVTAIIGPNGSGKSSLLKIIAGALPFGAGDVELNGKSCRAMPAIDRARHIAFVPQTFAQTLPLTVEEALRIAQYPQRDRADTAIDESLRRLGITHLRGRQCDSLSGGELRKVLIAQGLVQIHGAVPAALLLDEPVAFLDPPAQESIAQLVQLIARRDNMAVALVLHDLQLARKADAVLLLREGRLLAYGKPQEAMNDANITALYAETPQMEMATL